MYSKACTLFGLLALTSAGLLTPNSPSNVYLPVSSTHQQTNTLTKTSRTIHAPAVAISEQNPAVASVFHQQIPAVPYAIHQQVPAVPYAIHQQVPAVPYAIHQQVPAVPYAIHQQIPAARNSFVNTAQHISRVSAPSVALISLQQYPQTAQQVSILAKSSQPIQIQPIASGYQKVSNIASQSIPHFQQSTSRAQPFSSSVNTISPYQSTHTNAPAIPSFNSASFRQQVPIKQIAIVRLSNENVGDGTYSYNYETENGITAEEQGQVKIAGAETVERVQGSYSYTGPDGVRYAINYVADENGYRAEGAHLPVPPEPIASVSQVSSKSSHTNSNLVGSRSASIHVIPTAIVSQPIQIVQNPAIQSQSQLRSSYQQSPVIPSSQNVFRQATVAPSGTVSNAQQISADSFRNHGIQVSNFVQHSSTGSASQQSEALQAQVLQRQSAVVPKPFTVQSSAPSHHAESAHTVVVPASTASVQQTSPQQSDSVQTQVHQQTSTIVPGTVAVRNSAASQVGVYGNIQPGLLHQSIVPAVTVQHATSDHSTQQVAVGSLSAQQGGLQRQASALSALQHGAEYHARQFGPQVFQAQQEVPNKVSFGFVSGQQGTQQSLVQNAIASSNSDSVQQNLSNEQSSVVVQSVAVPSPDFIEEGISADNVYSAVQQSQAALPSGVVPVHLGKTGLIKQQNIVQAKQTSQRQTSGVSSNHVTVQLGTSGYATEQVGDVSSVQVFGGSSLENVTAPSQTHNNGQQVSQQAGVSSNAISSNVSEQPITITNPETTVSPRVVLPDGSVHNGY